MDKRKTDILIVAHFCGDFDGKGNNRFNYLAGLLNEGGFDVELVTSDYSHIKKQKRDKSDTLHLRYKVTYIKEPPYKKNISLNRFLSHYVFGKNLGKYLQNRKTPDAVYCAVPSLDAAGTALKYCRSHNYSIPLIIDVQDLWPEAFSLVADTALLSPVFYLMRQYVDRVYKAADGIIAVSETYAERALSVNRKCIDAKRKCIDAKRKHMNAKRKHMNAKCVYLGTELASFDQFVIQNRPDKPKNEIWVAYAGTLGHSYDLAAVIDALAIIKSRGRGNIKFFVMGDGPLKHKFLGLADDKGINAVFTGNLSYDKLAGMLGACDIAVNPISRGAAQSIINKHADYAAAGLPVLSTQESYEYFSLVEKYQMGFNCSDSNDLAEKLLLLSTDGGLRATMSKNSRRLAEERFDRGCTYQEIVALVQEVCAMRTTNYL